MADVIDLRQFRCAQLEGLLAAETAEWSRVLDWDYASSADLIRQYIEARILPGYVLVGAGRRGAPLGYGFYIYEAHKGMIGNVFVAQEQRTPERHAEQLLLRHMIATLTHSPGLERIEAQLMVFPPPALAGCFAAHGFLGFRRIFLELGLREFRATTAAGGAGATRHLDLRLEPWGGASYEEAAHLIQHAYQGHVDAQINDQYRSFAGAVRFMHNIAHYPGCGTFDPATSFLARSAAAAGQAEGPLQGMVLTSRVRPDVAHITQICVEPGQQGRGLGRALLERCLTRLRELGLRAATLTVTRDNQGADRLYRRMGFVPLSEFDAYTWQRPGREGDPQ